MRDALLMVIVAILSVMALFSPRYGLLGYLWFSLFRPDILAYSAGRPYSMILAVVTGASSLRAVPQAMALIRNPFVWLFIGYQVWTAFSVVTAQDVNKCFPQYTYFITFSVLTLLIPVIIRNRDDLRLLLLVLGGSIGLLGAKLGLYGILAGGVAFVQGTGGLLNDNNLLALAFVTGVPLMWYAVRLTTLLPLKCMFGFFLFTSLAAIAMCHSRGGILSLAFALVLMAWRSKHRALAFVVIGLLALPGVWLVRGTLMSRMATLSSVEDDQSATSRLTVWKAALRVSQDYPVFGVGFGSDNYRDISLDYMGGEFAHLKLVVHNTYLQMLADSGVPTLVLYCALLFGSILWLRRYARRVHESDPEMAGWSEAVWISLAGYSVGSIFLTRVGYDFPYMLMMAAATIYQIKVPEVMAAGSVNTGSQPAIEGLRPVEHDAFAVPPAAAESNEPAWRRPGAGRKLRSRQQI